MCNILSGLQKHEGTKHHWSACRVTARPRAGTFEWLNGDRYVGEWKEDEKFGQGMLRARARSPSLG